MTNGDRCVNFAIGADVGASRLKLVLLDNTGTIVRSTLHPTPQVGTGPEIVEEITTAIATFRDEAMALSIDPLGIGIVVPHFVEGSAWIQRSTNNMSALEGLELRPLLEERLGTNLAVANDVSAATMAEHMFGLGRGVNRFLQMSIGTGVSIGVVIDGELLQFTWGTAGDTGHIIVDTDGMHECTCGARGCLETVTSGTGIRESAVRAIQRGEITALTAQFEADQDFSAADVAEAARQGDRVARAIFDQAARFLAIALADYLQIFAPELIVLAGGVTESSDLWIDQARTCLVEFASPSKLSKLRGVKLSKFPHMGAAMGGASLILFPDRYQHTQTLTKGSSI